MTPTAPRSEAGGGSEIGGAVAPERPRHQPPDHWPTVRSDEDRAHSGQDRSDRVVEPDELWIFGYGSLIWRPDFPHARREPARINGWARRFWQGSTDHRGTPGAPGRVVTLIATPGEHCWGVVYQVAEVHRSSVLAYLDFRESGGYERLREPVLLRNGGTVVTALIYRATEYNPNFLGPAPTQQIAAQIAVSQGPSGSNLDYLRRLEQAIHELGVEDRHVGEVARAVDRRHQSANGT